MRVLILALGVIATPALGHPLLDTIPEELQGRWAATASACDDVDASTRFGVSAGSLEFYEDTGHLLIGKKTENLVSNGTKSTVGFYGRFVFFGFDGITYNDVELKQDGLDLLISNVPESELNSDNIRPEPVERRVRCPGKAGG